MEGGGNIGIVNICVCENVRVGVAMSLFCGYDLYYLAPVLALLVD